MKILTSVLVLTVAGTMAAILVMLAPDLQWFLPAFLRRRRVELALVGFAVFYAAVRFACRREPSGAPARDPLPWLLRGVDVVAVNAISGGLTVVVGMVCLAFLALWLPHYLLWPWARDADTFATLAQSWDAGIRPYRDIRGYNFPGAIYLAWVLGKAFGWGRTWTLYAFDASCLALLGLLLAAWSRRRLGGMFAGLAAYLIFLTSYLSRDFETVAQRDWYAGLAIVLGLLLLEGWPGRPSRIASALLAAAALSIRPHVILFLPAMAAAVLEGERDRNDAPPSIEASGTSRIADWFLAFGALSALAFSPLLFAGILDDLARGLRIAAYGGPYSRATPASVVEVLVEQLVQTASCLAIGLLWLLLAGTRGESRRRARTWMLALFAALAYRLFHPVQHAYLAHPLGLVGSVALALPLSWLVNQGRVPAPLRVIASVLLIIETSAGFPRFCNASAAGEAIATIAGGESMPVHSPPGSRAWFDPASGRWYAWEDYSRTLSHLRVTTGATTLVANVLKEPPFPAINGPTGRLSPFRAESGICWMWLVAVDLEPEFAAALERADDCVVVWSPGEHKLFSPLHLDRLVAVIREHFRPEARFGHIEVWRRCGPVPTSALPR